MRSGRATSIGIYAIGIYSARTAYRKSCEWRTSIIRLCNVRVSVWSLQNQKRHTTATRYHAPHASSSAAGTSQYEPPNATIARHTCTPTPGPPSHAPSRADSPYVAYPYLVTLTASRRTTPCHKQFKSRPLNSCNHHSRTPRRHDHLCRVTASSCSSALAAQLFSPCGSSSRAGSSPGSCSLRRLPWPPWRVRPPSRADVGASRAPARS